MTTPLQEPFAFVIFGASGDLSRRKLIPALYHLASLGYMPASYAVVGTARSRMTDEEFRAFARQAIEEHLKQEKTEEPADMARLLPCGDYHPEDTADTETFNAIRAQLDELARHLGLRANRLSYLPVAPAPVPRLVENLDDAGLLQPRNTNSWVRVV